MTLRIKGATTIKGLTSVNWSPNLLFSAGEQGVWYDPSDFSTMFQDTAGTTPVTATGQSVARINDKSGRGNNATQSDAAKQPTLQIDGNGKYYLLFDGSNDCLVTSNVDFSATSNISIWTGVRKTSDSNYGVVCELSSNSSANAGFGVWAPGWTNTGAYYGVNWRGSTGSTAAYNSPASYAAPITNVIAVGIDISQSTVAAQIPTFRINAGAVVGTTDGSAATGSFVTNPLYIGARGAGSLFLNGRIYGLIIRGAASTASQISMTEAYMNSKTAAY